MCNRFIGLMPDTIFRSFRNQHLGFSSVFMYFYLLKMTGQVIVALLLKFESVYSHPHDQISSRNFGNRIVILFPHFVWLLYM